MGSAVTETSLSYKNTVAAIRQTAPCSRWDLTNCDHFSSKYRINLFRYVVILSKSSAISERRTENSRTHFSLLHIVCWHNWWRYWGDLWSTKLSWVGLESRKKCVSLLLLFSLIHRKTSNEWNLFSSAFWAQFPFSSSHLSLVSLSNPLSTIRLTSI